MTIIWEPTDSNMGLSYENDCVYVTTICCKVRLLEVKPYYKCSSCKKIYDLYEFIWRASAPIEFFHEERGLSSDAWTSFWTGIADFSLTIVFND